jgi:hypothetical protein
MLFSGEAVLLIDNCSGRVSPEIFRLLRENHIKIVTRVVARGAIWNQGHSTKKVAGWGRSAGDRKIKVMGREDLCEGSIANRLDRLRL